MKSLFKKTLAASAMGFVLGLASTSASAEFMDFKINEGVVPGAAANTFTADKLNGGYTEFLAPTSLTTFAAAAVGNIGQIFANEGTTLTANQLNNFGANGYGLYAIFNASGNILGPNLFQGVAGSFSLYIDVNQDTKFTSFNAAENPLATPTADLGTNGDDILLAFTTSLVTGSGNLNGPPGAFDIVFKDFTLTAFGSTYFYDPVPFHMIVDVNGDYDAFTTNPLTGVSKVTGDVSAVFVPEPGTLALMGLALAGLGFTQRRRKFLK